MPEVKIAKKSIYDKEHRLRSGVSSAIEEERSWSYGIYNIEHLAQDQAIIRFRHGLQVEAYRSLKIDSGDTQSDILHAFETRHYDQDALARLVKELLRRVMYTLSTDRFVEDAVLEQDSPSNSEIPLIEIANSNEPVIADGHVTECAPAMLADKILHSNEENDWPYLRDLIILAEDTGFTPQQSARLAPRLLELAMRHRDSNDPQDKPVVWSAIRTGASMLRLNEAGCLRPLLDPGHSIETSLVTVKMLGRIFEAQPPGNVDQYPELAAEVCQIAKSLLNRYAIASSQSAAMAQLAIYALAAMASSSILRITQFVRDLQQSWFTDQVGHELRELRKYWDCRIAIVATGPRELLVRAIRELGVD